MPEPSPYIQIPPEFHHCCLPYLWVFFKAQEEGGGEVGHEAPHAKQCREPEKRVLVEGVSGRSPKGRTRRCRGWRWIRGNITLQGRQGRTRVRARSSLHFTSRRGRYLYLDLRANCTYADLPGPSCVQHLCPAHVARWIFRRSVHCHCTLPSHPDLPHQIFHCSVPCHCALTQARLS